MIVTDRWPALGRARWFPFLVLALVSALVYLPKLAQLTYYRDDWYYMYDGLIGGAGIFNDMFSSDRPIRGLFFELYFNLFGVQPFGYALGAYLWRLASAVSALWFFNLLWPARRNRNLLTALLVLVYPGYLWWVAGIEYQPMIASFCLQVVSMALMVKAAASEGGRMRTVYAISAVATGWLYILLVDYAIGMEFFRLLVMYVVVARQARVPVLERLRAVFRQYRIYLIIPAGYLVWQLFVFQNERKATDLGLQVGGLISSPLSFLWGMVHWMQSFLNVTLMAWFEPFGLHQSGLRLGEIMAGLLLAGLVAGLVLLARRLHPDDSAAESPAQDRPQDWIGEAVLIGGLGALIGILPIVAVNRYIEFERFSHYALPASLAASVLAGAVISAIADRRVQTAAWGLVFFLAASSQYAVAAHAAAEQRIIADFWWQMAWRAPALKENTSLLVNYPSVVYGEDYETVSGPANFIYFGGTPAAAPVPYRVSAISMTAIEVRKILARAPGADRTVRSHVFSIDYGNVLVISQPSVDACVRVVDSRWSEYSVSELESILLTGPLSRVENVGTEGPLPAPPAFLFGAEPEHEWCYFYQRAALARQQQDWQRIADLGSQVTELGLQPNDPVEWMPFLQAYALLGDEKQVKQISTRVNTELSYKRQACANLLSMDELQLEMQAYVRELFCAGRGQ